MSRYNGMVETRKVDRLLSSEELDRDKRHALLQFQQELDAIIMSANQEVLRRKLPGFNRETMTRMAVRVAELRGSYLAKALKLAEAEGAPSVAAIDELRHARAAYDEIRDAFEALHRIIERGYTKIA
ncbi:MAG: hypothetical protein R3F55_07370 [Alphaproteobacteria bacterium]